MEQENNIKTRVMFGVGLMTPDTRNLNKFIKHYNEFKNCNDKNSVESQCLLNLCLSDLQSVESTMSKFHLMDIMNEKEAENYRQEEIRIAKDIKAANNDLATLKLQLNAAQISKQNKQVYDEIAKEIRAYQARDKSEEIISGFQNLISKSEEEKKHLEQAEELRRRKFIAIVNACLDAKDAIDEEIWEREERERLEMKKVEDSDEDDADDDKKDLMDEN